MEERRKNRVPVNLRAAAQELRWGQTRAEDLFWTQVRAGRFHGYKFKRQVPIAPYVVDFLCASARVVVELDGPLHEADTQRRHDARRDAFLRQQGFRVLRFSNDVFLGNPQLVMDQVLQALRRTESLPPLRGRVPPEGGRERGRARQDSPSPGSLRSPPSPAEGRGLDSPSPGSLRSPPSPAEGRGGGAAPSKRGEP